MSEFAVIDDIPQDLRASISQTAIESGTSMRDGEYSHEEVGTTNSSGDDQLHVDLATEAVIFDKLKGSGVCIMASSEETPEEISCNADTGYSVSFDPLDGSSIIDANFAVGTICGIWPGAGLLNRTGREQAASFIAQYGPRVTIMLAINDNSSVSGQALCMELTMLPNRWIITHHNVSIAPKSKTFAPGNLRAIAENENYRRLVDFWIANKYTLRYSGGLVPDVYHILTKGQGVLSNASSKSAKAKLRLLFECAPVALVIEAAGGASTVSPCEAGQEERSMSLLDVPISHLDKRVGVCFGSREEVERFIQYIFA